jgi:hypothetical protein
VYEIFNQNDLKAIMILKITEQHRKIQMVNMILDNESIVSKLLIQRK